MTKKTPYKGLGADSEEKHEPASDIDTVMADSLKALDPPNGRLEKQTSSIAAAPETGKLVDVTRGVNGFFRATTMPEIAVPFPLRRATAGTVHPADLIAIYRWRPAGQTGAL